MNHYCSRLCNRLAISQSTSQGDRKAIVDFIFHEIYMHYGTLQEIFTDSGKNLWGSVVQKNLEKIQTVHKGSSPYHPQTNGKVERLNGILEDYERCHSNLSWISHSSFFSKHLLKYISTSIDASTALWLTIPSAQRVDYLSPRATPYIYNVAKSLTKRCIVNNF